MLKDNEQDMVNINLLEVSEDWESVEQPVLNEGSFVIAQLSESSSARLVEALAIQARFSAEVTTDGLPAYVASADDSYDMAETLLDLPEGTTVSQGTIDDKRVYLSVTYQNKAEVEGRPAVISSEVRVIFEDE